MREILFRGKSKSTGKWVYGYLVEGNDWNTNEPITAIIETDAVFYPRNEIVSYEVVDPETVGQWTGLVDCHGVKIFEGDIHGVPHWVVTYLGDNDGDNYEMQTGWYVQRDDFESWMPLECCNEHNIIGNIHDNPELLT